MRKIALLALSVIAVSLLSHSLLASQTPFNDQQPENKKPRVVILATGGTIAGSASSSTQASYKPGVLSIEQILKTVPEIEMLAQLKGIQVSNIASQNMEEGIWLELWRTIDNLFSHDLCDGVVITHGTDTMEESAYFLNLTIRHTKPVVITGAMRASTSLSPDGPFNLFNAVALAASATAQNRGVMVVMNDYILSADDVTKTNTINTNAFECPNFGPLGYMRDGTPHFFRESRYTHTASSIFNIKGLTSLPKTEIVYAYAFSSDVAINALIDNSTDGIVIAGVGHGNYNKAIAEAMVRGSSKGVTFVRSSRIIGGGVDLSAENYDPKWPVSFNKTPQKARILLKLALTITKEPKEIQKIFMEY